MTQKSVSGQSVIERDGEYVVHPCREEMNYSDIRVHGYRTTWSCALILYNYNRYLTGMFALGLLPRRESRKDLWA